MSVAVRNFDDWTGRTTQQGLQVLRLTALKPVRYAVKCVKCLAETTEPHSRIAYAPCRNASCGKPVRSPRERLEESQRIANERRADLEAAQLQASLARMEAETEDFEAPTRYAPKPSEHKPMSERERQSLRQEREAEEAARLESDRPARELRERQEREQRQNEQAEQERAERQRLYWRDAILSGPDPRLFVSPELANAKMPKVAADQFNAEQVQTFIANTPEYAEYRTPENSTAILDYLDLNGVRIADAATYRAAFHRLRDLNIVTKRTVSVTKPTPAPKRTPEPVKPTGLVLHIGRDPLTGLPREYTSVEVNRMSSAEYRKSFPVALSVGELFASIGDSRK